MIWPFNRTKPKPKQSPGPMSELMFIDLTYRDPLELAHVELRDLSTSVNSVWVEREAGSYPDLHRPPDFHDYARPGGLADLNEGLPPERPAVFIMTLDDVLLTGCRGLVTKDGHYCFDESISPAAQAAQLSTLGAPEIHLNQWMGFVNSDKAGQYQLQTPKPIIEIDEPVILLTSSEGPNFGAFIYRMLPKIAAIARLSNNIKILAPIYHDTFRQFLIASGVAAERIIPHFLVDHWYRLKRVYVPSIRNRDVWLDRQTIALYDRMRMVHGSMAGDRKIFLSRKGMDGHPRRMVNEPELIEALTIRGFEVVLPETLTAVEQIQTFSSAGTIVAGAGSAIYNAAFCYPGTRFVDIESEPHWIRGHIRLFASRGLNYGVFEGLALDTSGRPHVPFQVDVPGLMGRLDSFMSTKLA